MRGTTGIDPATFQAAETRMRQDLTGGFIDPLEVDAQQRASRILREEEEQKILTGSP
jgi:hypothetical protein